MSSSVEKIKERLSIVDVISSYLKLEKAGGNYKAPCPFHNETTPSFFISPTRNSYYCFGCGAKGDIFTFVEQFEGLDFKGALKQLAARAGVELEAYRGSDPKEKNEKDRLYELMDAAAKFYQGELRTCEDALAYLKKRGVTEITAAGFRIGYAPKEWRTLSNEMRKAGFSDKELVLAGLAKHPDENPSGEIYDRFRDRIMFPISDTGGRIIAFSGRMLHDDGSGMQGKYINSPETPIFKKGSTLYGLDKAKFEIRKRDAAILVEGQLDLVLSHQAGFANTVASSGTALGDSLIADTDRGLLSGLGAVHALTKNLIVAFDADKAGLRAAGKAEKIGLGLGMNVKVAKLPSGLDPADTILQNGSEAWKKIVDGAQHIVLVYLSVLMEHPLSDLTRARAINEKILPYIAVMPSAVERVHFIREIAVKTGIPEEALTEDVIRLMVTSDKPSPSVQSPDLPAKDTRSTRIEDRLFGIVFWQESLANPTLKVDVVKDRLKSIVGDERYKILLDMPDDKKNERIFEVELVYADADALKNDIEELLDNLEEETLGGALQSLIAKMANAERGEDGEMINNLLAESQKITTRLNTIKSNRFLHT